ncbi:MAG: choice-of-anchor D domain-containing protein [Verrucomicrobiota bacterium]
MKIRCPFAARAVLPGALALLCAAATPAAESIHPDTVSPAARGNDAPSWELGTIFRAKLAGSITHVRVFSLAEESGEHQVRIWRNADSNLVSGPISWTFGGDEAWITLDIPDVPIEAGQDYTVAVSAPAEGWYPANGAYFANAGGNGQFLDFPQAAGVFSDTAAQRPTSSFNNSSYLRDIVFEANLSGTIMQVNWNGQEITNGSTNYALVNGTDLGGKGLNAGARELVYAITNIGQTALQLTGSPLVAITGENAGDFTVTAQPSATVAGNGSTTFKIRFDPSAIGPRRAVVSIPHGDSAGDPFDFAILGHGLGGGAGVLGNDSDGAFARNIDDNQIHGNRYQAPVDMRITDLWAKVLELTGTMKCALYSDTNGTADRLLRSSVDVVNPTNGWNKFTLTAPLDLTAGDSYWLVIWSDTVGARVQADPVGGAYSGFYSWPDLSGEWPDQIVLPDLIRAEPRTYCIYAEGAAIGTAPGPELDVRGSGKLIVSGDAAPSGLDGTDFGNLSVAGGNAEHTFTLENRGDAAIDFTGTPVVLTGPHAADFALTAQPSGPLAPGGTASFKVRFDPSVRGLRSATVTIANNDLSENPYNFAVQGAGFLTGRETIWPDSKVGRDIDFDGTYYELGTVFRSSVPGKITHVRVYSLAAETGDHTARLWQNDTEEVVGGPYTWNYGGFTGWITLDIPDVDILADTDYTVSVSTGTSAKRNYPNIAADLSAAGNNGQSLSYPVNAGVFTETREGRPTSSFNGGNYLRDIVFIPAGVTVDLPDMDVKGNNTSIADGDTTPAADDGSDFGSAVLGSGSVERTFTLLNVGKAPLNLSSTPIVAITGPAAADFTVVAQPTTPVAPAGQVTFRIRFAPSAAGARNATVSIENDSDESPYDFAITGTGGGGTTGLRIVEIKPDLSAGSVTLRWEGDGAQFQVEKAAEVTGPFQAAGATVTTKSYTDTGAVQPNTRAFYRVKVVP